MCVKMVCGVCDLVWCRPICVRLSVKARYRVDPQTWGEAPPTGAHPTETPRHRAHAPSGGPAHSRRSGGAAAPGSNAPGTAAAGRASVLRVRAPGTMGPTVPYE